MIPILEKLGYQVLDWNGQRLNLPSYKGHDQLLTVLAGKPENIKLFFEQLENAGLNLLVPSA